MSKTKSISVAILGSRDFNNYELLKNRIDKILIDKNVEQLISGGANGTDKLAEKYASDNNYQIKVIKPDWKKGKWAGLERNSEIIEQSDIVIAFWNGISRGTFHIINKTEKLNKQLYIINIMDYPIYVQQNSICLIGCNIAY